MRYQHWYRFSQQRVSRLPEIIFVQLDGSCSAKLTPMSDVTRILNQIEQGDPAASEGLLPLVYEQLRAMTRAPQIKKRRTTSLKQQKNWKNPESRFVFGCTRELFGAL